MRTSFKSRPGPVAVSALLVLALSLALPSFAPAQDNPRGAELLQEVEGGERNCDDLQAADFEAMGDSLMGRMVGSSQAHESMDALMRKMMGRSGETQMHAALGERFSGCGSGRLPAGTAGMMNGAGGMMVMMAMMGGYGGPGASSGMMGGGQGPAGMMGGGHGGMMGGGSMMGSAAASDDEDDDDGAGWAVVAMVVTMLLLIAGVFVAFRRVSGRGVTGRPAGEAPVEILKRRFATGEISQADFERRLALLGGPK